MANKKKFTAKSLFQPLLSAVILALVCFYLMPLLVVDTGSGILILLICIPLICFFGGLVAGILTGFHWYFALAVTLLFFPAMFLYLNPSAWVYGPAYGILSLLGSAFGGWLKRHGR